MPNASFILILLMACTTYVANAQGNRSVIYKEIEAALKHKSKTDQLRPFSWKSNDGISSKLSYKPIPLKKSNNDHLIEMVIPQSADQEVTLLLKETAVLSRNKSWNKLKSYRGIVKGQDNSWASINITDQTINGIIATPHGNTMIEMNSDGDVETYDSRNKPQVQWTCSSPKDHVHNSTKNHDFGFKNQSEADTIRVYVDCDHALYQWKGSDVSQTINYVNSLFNDVAALYQNEGITLIVEDIHVWTTLDPFDKDDNRDALYDFQEYLSESFDADFAILLSGYDQLSGGLAFVNSLCQKSRAYSYANVRSSAQSSSSYSWQTHVVAHELGHNLGSPHTHDCKWGPSGNQALDNCYTNSCELAPSAQSGTIMSYCHLSGQSGVHFAHGFGQEPGDTIRARIAECRSIVGIDCATALTIAVSSKDTVLTTLGPKMGDGASQSDTEHASWYRFTPPSDGTISVNSCSRGVDTRLHVHVGYCGDLDRIATQDDNCDMGNGLSYASSIDDLAVSGGETYYIEWDNRWSTNGFDFVFSYEAAEVEEPVDLCNNGILDEGEEDVDCGGTACIPCSSCEFASSSNTNNITQVSELRSNSGVSYDGHISSTGDLMISSAQSITFEAGFEINAGGVLDAIIESCAEYFDRIIAQSSSE